jgi:hypothetical protein
MVLLARTRMSSDQQALWLTQVSTMKFGTKALRRAVATDTAKIVDSLVNIKVDGRTSLEGGA